jgi:hypothetical protein
MAVRDQYFTPKSSEFSESIEVLDTEEKVVLRLQEMFAADWVDWDGITKEEKNITVLVHAPSSLLDMRRLDEHDFRSVRLTDIHGNLMRVGEQGPALGLLPCRNFGSTWLTGYIYETAEILGVEPRIISGIVTEVGKDYKECGAFQPSHLGKFGDDDGINPLLFSVAMALKLKKEANGHDHRGRFCVVTHPDQLYFMANGNVENIPEVSQRLGGFYRLLQAELFIENPVFNHQVFRECLAWMEDPEQIAT